MNTNKTQHKQHTNTHEQSQTHKQHTQTHTNTKQTHKTTTHQPKTINQKIQHQKRNNAIKKTTKDNTRAK